MIKLDKWSTTTGPLPPFIAPELLPTKLQGIVTGHPTIRDGFFILTSKIEKACGRTVTTKSRTVYHLGKIDPKFRRWLRKNRPNWNWRQPISCTEE